MTVVAAVIARLEMLPALVALVESRIVATHLDHTADKPAVLVQRVSRRRGQHLRGPDNITRYRVQVDSVATSQAVADEIADLIEGDGKGPQASGLMGWKGRIGSPPVYIDNVAPDNEREHYDPPPIGEYRVQRDYVVSFRGL